MTTTQSQPQSTNAQMLKAELPSAKLARPWWKPQSNSIGSRLFLYVMGGALVGLGGMSCFFYQTLKQEAQGKIQGALNYQVATVQGQLTEVERSTADMSSSINLLRRMGIKDPASYKNLTFELYRKRVSLTMAVGFGQLPNQIVPSVKYYYPYFYTVKGFPDRHLHNRNVLW